MRASTQPIVVGPTAERDPDRLFDAALDATARAGYEPVEIDRARGEYRIVPRYRAGRGPVWVHVQVYRDGWVRLFPLGPGAQRDSHRIWVPAAIVREHQELAVALGRALRPTASAEAVPGPTPEASPGAGPAPEVAP
jgi:hypothetical protein